MAEPTNNQSQAFATKVLFTIFGVALSGILAWMWQIDKDRHQQTEIATKMTAVVKDLEKVVKTLEQVKLNSQSIEGLTEITKRMAKWQEDWPRTGLLQADVKQNANIEFLRAELDRTNATLAAVQRKVTTIQISIARAERAGPNPHTEGR